MQKHTLGTIFTRTRQCLMYMDDDVVFLTSTKTHYRNSKIQMKHHRLAWT